ncbi:MAG: heme-binding domain-containing protein [Desulfuromonadaceae bacterium]|nr:heme-binding domain-containing protein [Desulfuromonadaceae bacterium]
MSTKSKKIVVSAVAAIATLVIIQAIPYGRNHSNPPIVREPSWDSPATRAIAKRACFDCHSNETIWPWYSRIAPASWLVQSDVDEARSKMNFSDWQNGARKAENPETIHREISEGGMPPFRFRIAHPEARLSDAEKTQLIEGIKRMFPRH